MPRALITWAAGSSAAEVRSSLRAGQPRIDVAAAGRRSLHLNAELLSDDQVEIVADRVRDVLSTQSFPAR